MLMRIAHFQNFRKSNIFWNSLHTAVGDSGSFRKADFGRGNPFHMFLDLQYKKLEHRILQFGLARAGSLPVSLRLTRTRTRRPGRSRLRRRSRFKGASLRLRPLASVFYLSLEAQRLSSSSSSSFFLTDHGL